MNYLLVLSGGVGSRINSEVPKQYIEINNKPVIEYTLSCFEIGYFDQIVVVVSDEWKSYLDNIMKKLKITNFRYAPAGDSRQESILNGLNELENISDDDIVVIHDAARANLKMELVLKLIAACQNSDGAMPVIPVKDTIYLSENHCEITGLLNRDSLFAGQAPEAFKLNKYRALNSKLTKEELSNIRGSSELAYKNGMVISLIPGDENNFKITTREDLIRFEQITQGAIK